ncbi:MAG: thioredoxin family protein, partial [Planctomycetota bacterium]
VPAVQSTTPAHAGTVINGEDRLWLDSVDEALRVAAETNRHVLIDFTGTGWCGFCKRLDGEVLSTAPFLETMPSKYVLVRLDFDAKGSARTDLPHAAKNDALKATLGVDGFPRIVTMTAAGVPYGELGYERGGARPYVEKLEKLHGQAAELETAVPMATSAIAAARSKEDAEAAADAVVALLRDAGPHALAAPLIPVVRAVLNVPEIAPERERAGLLALFAANEVEDALIDRAFRVDPANKAGVPEAALAAAVRTVSDASAIGPLIQRIEDFMVNVIVHDPNVAAQLYGDCAYYIRNWQNDEDRARVMASFALRLGPKDKALTEMLKNLAGR